MTVCLSRSVALVREHIRPRPLTFVLPAPRVIGFDMYLKLVRIRTMDVPDAERPKVARRGHFRGPRRVR